MRLWASARISGRAEGRMEGNAEGGSGCCGEATSAPGAETEDETAEERSGEPPGRRRDCG